MTEAEWLACTDLNAMLAYVWDRTTDRKLRLFACACVRRAWHLLKHKRSRLAIELAERYADGETGDRERRAEVTALASGLHRRQWKSDADFIEIRMRFAAKTAIELEGLRLAEAVAGLTAQVAADAAVGPAPTAESSFNRYQNRMARALGAERAAQCALLRDIVGNPFSALSVVPTWLFWNERCVPKIAQAVYVEHRFHELPVLGDALLDAGCDNEAILAHCRAPGPHMRGCWVVDLLLGKT
jgi:hypothetical protein